MTKQEMGRYWRYFESIDADLLETCKYVEHDDSNLKVYSNAFARIILAANSEIDVICRLFSYEIDPGVNYADDTVASGNIKQYANVILGKYPKLINTSIESITLKKTILPWQDWTIAPNYNSPIWWKDYQKVKHYRHSNFQLASLENAIFSVAALCILLLYFNKHVLGYSGIIEGLDSACFYSRAMLDIDESSFIHRYDVEQLPDFR